LQIPAVFDFEKYFSADSTEKPFVLSFCGAKYNIPIDFDKKDVIIKCHNHTCIASTQSVMISMGNVKPLIDPLTEIKKQVTENPLLSLREPETWKKMYPNVTFPSNKLENFLKGFRKTHYPSDKSHILNNKYCLTIDEDEAKRQNFYQGRKEFTDPKGNIQEYVIFSTKFALSILAKSRIWYVDATFKIAPKTYKQVLVIMGQAEGVNIPCIHVVMTVKCEALYSAVFNDIKELFGNHGLKNEMTAVMCDFEEAISKAVKKVFPGTNIKRCYFHYC